MTSTLPVAFHAFALPPGSEFIEHAGLFSAQYLTYSACIAFLSWRGRSKITPGPFWHPRLGYLADVVTIVWTVVALFIYCFLYYLPVLASQMNYVSRVLVGVFVYALIHWFAFGMKQFVLPEPVWHD